MENRLTDSEWRIMEILWKEGETSAKHLSDVLGKELGWNINTTYTLIKRCIGKGAIERKEPGFRCVPLLRQEDARRAETEKLLDKAFSGSVDLLLTALLGSDRLTEKQIRALQKTIEEMERE